MTLDNERLAGLARTKLRSLVTRTFPDVTAEPVSFNTGVGLVDGARAFVYLIGDGPSPLAAALAWGPSQGATELHIVLDEPDPLLVRQALGLQPVPTLWRVVDNGMEPVVVAPVAGVGDPAPAALALLPVLEDAGCDVTIEHGVIVGELLGLEVARVVVDADGGADLRVGVGLYDQEAHALMHARSSVEERLAQVIDHVRSHRTRDASPHPLNRVARARWLRAVVLAEPERLGLDHLDPLAPLEPRGGIHEDHPVAAHGLQGTVSVLVVASAGIDLDLVPHAAGHLAATGADRAILLLPARDHHPAIERQAQYLRVPAELVAIDEPWPI